MFNATPSQTPPISGLFRKVYLVFKYATILFFSISLFSFLSSCWHLYKAERVAGTVVDIISHTSRDRKSGTSSTSYTPVFEYRYKGETLRHEATFGSGTFTYALQDEVEMLVNPDSGTVKANSFLELWFLPLMLAGVGAFFMLFAVVIPKIARTFQGAFSLGSQPFQPGQKFQGMKPDSTQDVTIIEFKDKK
jgi:hypothetical protein